MTDLWGLWPHQEEAITQIENAWRDGVRSVCYQCPTGGGKTAVLRQIVDNHAHAKKVIYIIAHQRNLVNQLSREINDAGIQHGIIAAGSPYLRYRCQVASLQTIIKRMERLPEPELIVIDEFHHAKSASYLALINRWPQALILGTTATPARLDGKPLSDVADRLILGPTMRELIDGGYLADYEYYAPQQIEAPQHMNHGDYRLDEVEALVDKKAIIGSAVEHYRRHANGLPAIASCASIAHAEHVAAGFRDAGYRAIAVHSRMAQADIEASLTGLRDGSVQIVTQCELLGEGIDIPGATVLIGLRHTASLTVYLQHVGRVLRRSNGKKHAIILDHVSNWSRHGLPDDPREWTLEGRSKRDTVAADYKRCPDCFHIVAKVAKVCDFCGYLWTRADSPGLPLPEEAAGVLEAVRRPTIKLPWLQLIEQIRHRAHGLKDAEDIARSYGYSHRAGWSVWKIILKKY